LLQQGEVPGLFPNDEKAKIIEEVYNTYDSKVDEMTNNEKFEFFKKKCKENISICLCFSPVNSLFRKRLRSFPSFINNTTIDWYLDWPKTALSEVSSSLLNDFHI